MIIAAVTLVTLGLAAAYTALSPRTYAATTQFFVSTSGDDTTSSLAQGNTFTQARVKSYSQLLESPKVLDPVIKKVGLDTTADRLAAQVTSTIPLDTVIIDVSVTSDSPAGAQRIAAAVGDVFPQTIQGGIAYDSDASAHPLIVQVDPRSQRAEAFRSLRTNLQFIDVANPPKSIVVTSSLPGEGKSTTTANLALSLAETGLKVVVIEGDLRRPRLLDYLGFEGSVGLTDVLVGRVQVDDVLQPFGRTGLRLLGAGPIPPNPSELLGSANMEQLVADLAERFDYVLIDAPPLLPVTDAAVLSTIVVGAGVAQREHVRRALESLEAVNGSLLGLILNRVKTKELGAGYGTYAYDYRPESERQRAKGLGRGRRRPAAGSDEVGPVNPRSSAVGDRRPPEPGPHAHESSAAPGDTPGGAPVPQQQNGTKPTFPTDDSIFR